MIDLANVIDAREVLLSIHPAIETGWMAEMLIRLRREQGGVVMEKMHMVSSKWFPDFWGARSELLRLSSLLVNTSE